MNIRLTPNRQPSFTRQSDSRIQTRTMAQSSQPAHGKVAPVIHQLDPESLRQQALNSAQQGNYGEAIALLTQLIDRNPDNATHYNNRGLLYFQSNQFAEALEDYDQALQLNPRLAKVYNNRANCYAALGCLAEAIADYETALDLDPANVRARVNQGITFRDLEMYSQAIDNFDLALQFSQMLQNPNEAGAIALEGHIYAERGRTYHLSGEWNCAVADYRRALKIFPAEASIAGISQRLRSQVQSWLNELLEPLG